MKVIIRIQQAWANTDVIIDGDKRHVEKVLEAIKGAFKDDYSVEIK